MRSAAGVQQKQHDQSGESKFQWIVDWNLFTGGLHQFSIGYDLS
jgi:hypothetical protein